MKLSEADAQMLLSVARQAIENGLRAGSVQIPECSQYSAQLKEVSACFVTLTINKELRGCIGNLNASEPLIANVAHNAYNAAFKDTRFLPLREEELARLHIEISILTPPQAMLVSSEAELLAQLKPGTDGLLIRSGSRQATLLPSVWESLREPKTFLQHLKAKARFSPNEWPEDMQCFRYHTIKIEE